MAPLSLTGIGHATDLAVMLGLRPRPRIHSRRKY
jgi:hypothetical protein